MARGWESKSVEEQMEAAAEAPSAANPSLSPQEAEKERQRQNLLLARTQVQSSLERCQNERYRQMLEKALADLNSRLDGLGKCCQPASDNFSSDNTLLFGGSVWRYNPFRTQI